MNKKNLRLTILGLLLFTGILHFAVAMTSGREDLIVPLAVFGLIYTTLGFFVRKDTNDGSPSGSRNAIITAMVACTLGVILGGQKYLTDGGPVALPIMFLIDAVIIIAGALWLMKAAKA